MYFLFLLLTALQWCVPDNLKSALPYTNPILWILRAVLHIQDEGCGIDPRDIRRIYDLFFTGQNGRQRGESSGLGLYMVKQILDYLGHTIEVQSEAGTRQTAAIWNRYKPQVPPSLQALEKCLS